MPRTATMNPKTFHPFKTHAFCDVTILKNKGSQYSHSDTCVVVFAVAFAGVVFVVTK